MSLQIASPLVSKSQLQLNLKPCICGKGSLKREQITCVGAPPPCGLCSNTKGLQEELKETPRKRGGAGASAGMPEAAAVIVALLLLRTTKSQLEVEIRQYSQRSSEEREGSFTVLAEYSFPSGFSGDWFITSHAHIPSEGITGLLCHPEPKDDCYPFNASIANECYSQDSEFSRIAIIENLCMEQTIDFDAMITYSPGDIALDVNSYQTNGVPFAIVSEEFFFILQDSLRNCSSELNTLVSLDVGNVDVAAVRVALVLFTMMCGMMFMCVMIILLFVTAVICGKCLKRTTGSYDVHENQLNQLGPNGGEHCSFRGTLTLPYKPEQRQFNTENAANTQCSICLEDFVEEEMTSVLACSASHTFHPSCIDKWLESQNTCPVCRTFMMDTLL